ncbi:MAG: PAS domain S-box protein [Dehalococcoidales bacterium]|nr:PAS domain S-box protein [Dehalococcoidales bacterium]
MKDSAKAKEQLTGEAAALEKGNTECKRLKTELKESEARYRTLVGLGREVGQAVIMLQDTKRGEAVHTFVSDQWLKITGYSRSKLLAVSFFDLVPPENRAGVREMYRRKMRGEVIPGYYELSIIRKDGTEVPVQLVSARTTYQGRAANVACVRDITERKQMEQRLVITGRLASVGELASGVTHEINNPLTSVIGFSQLLLEKDIGDDIKEDVKIIASEAQRAAGVVKNLLAFARNRGPARQMVSINDIIAKVLELRAYEQKVNNIRTETRFAADLPEVMADYFHLQQAFLNIIINAEYFMVEAHKRGTLTITTKRTGSLVSASFADDGPGIPEENRGRLFDAFFTTKEVGKGTGLGLSICRGIVKEHGGRISVAGKPGEGATFSVELPVAAQQ